MSQHSRSMGDHVRVTGLRTYVQVIRNPYPKHGEPFLLVALDRSSLPEAAGIIPARDCILIRVYP